MVILLLHLLKKEVLLLLHFLLYQHLLLCYLLIPLVNHVLLMSRWHLLNTIDQTEYFIVADDSTSSLQKDNKTNPLQGLATVHSQGIDGNVSLPKEGGRKNKEENKESKSSGENEDSGKWESGSGRSGEGIKTSGIGEYGKDETGERNNVKSQVKLHNPQTDHRNTPSSLLFPNL